MNLNALVELEKAKIWNDPATADNLETLGIMVSKFTEWSGDDIVKVFLAALEDANFHTFAAEIKERSDRYFETI